MWRVIDENDDSINKKIDRLIDNNKHQDGRIGRIEVGLAILFGSGVVGTGLLEWKGIINLIGG